MAAVTLVVWRDAKTDPPEWDGMYQTDVGFYTYSNGGWQSLLRTAPRPSVWCDPVPPGEDALTTEHLRVLADAAWASRKNVRLHDDDYPLLIEAEARVRRALEQMEADRA